MQELLLAAFVGLSLGNSWLCLFMAFGVSTAELRTGAWFLAGRMVGLVALGLLIIVAGMFLDISPKLMQVVAGMLAVAFGAVLVVQNLPLIASKKRVTSNEVRKCDETLLTKGGGRRNEGGGTECQGPESRQASQPNDQTSFSTSEPDQHHKHKTRPASQPMNTAHRGDGSGPGCKHRRKHELALDGGGECETKRGEMRREVERVANSRTFGFGFGVLRGITPCFKIVVLAPLMVAVPFTNAIGMVLVFVAVSMIYPLIGFISAGTLHNLVRNRKLMLVIGGSIMIIIGLYYIYEVAISYGVHVPGAGGA